MDAKEIYINSSHENTPIFHKPYYLDAVIPNGWDVCLYQKGEKILGSMPFILKQNNKNRVICEPSMTQYLGPWFWDNLEDISVSNYGKILDQLYSQLPPHDIIEQSWHYRLNNCLPMYSKGYTLGVRYTYQMPSVENPEQWIARFNSNAKRNLKKANNNLTVKILTDFDLFFNMLKSTFERKRQSNPYQYDKFKRLDEAFIKHDSRQILGAYDEGDELCGAVYLMWDKYNVYYLAGGIKAEKSSTGAIHLLFMEGFKKAHIMNKVFDFEGSMIPQVELFFRSFGSIPKPYYHIKKINSKKLKLKYLASDILKTFRS